MMRLGYDLITEQSQKLVMTPELIQAIQILQFNTYELEDFVQEQLLVNPVLEQVSSGDTAGENNGETGDEARLTEDSDRGSSKEKFEGAEEDFGGKEWLDAVSEKGYDDISYKQRNHVGDDGSYSFEQFVSSDISLVEHLMFQLQFFNLGSKGKAVGRYIIESLDDNGYMTQTVDEIAEATRVVREKVGKVLKLIQSMEPPGVAASDLTECLLIQLRAKGMLGEKEERVVKKHLVEIAENKLGIIAKDMNISLQEAQGLRDLIKSLEPKPGRQFASQSVTKYIVPDVIVEKIDGEYVVSINEAGSPRLMISAYYEKLLREGENDITLTKFLSERMNSAVWLIRSIEQRKHTIFNVVSAVVKYQQEFFEKGKKYLKPLTLKQIAEEIGIHESTVSRSVSGKYMQSPMGMFEIRYFFSGAVSDHHGGSVASQSVKTMIQEIVALEDAKNPYSDQAIVELLLERDVEISRRTVAKYRDELNILSSSKRKRF